MFRSPSVVAVDALGTVFVADYHNHLIRKIGPGGVVSTFAGGGSVGGNSYGHEDGTGVAATFFYPFGICFDALGVMFVADSENNLIRRISALGVVTTLAGGGSAGGTASGHTDGVGTAATFDYPTRIAVDAAGALFVVDAWNNLIRKITVGAFAVVTTFAGGGGPGGIASGRADGIGTAATFHYMLTSGLAIDGSGSLFVADTWNNLIRHITPDGSVTTFAGGGGLGGTASGHADGSGVLATFNRPGGIAIGASGSLIIADSENHLIRKITAGGEVTTLAGGGGAGGVASGNFDGDGIVATFYKPYGVAVDPLSGSIYVTDAYNNLVRKVVVPFLPILPACDATWRHVALAYAPSPASGALSAFLDGILVAFSPALVTLPAVSSSGLRIGWSGDLSANAGSLFAGNLADVRLYNRTLAPGEILALSQPAAASFAGAGLAAASPLISGAKTYLFACSGGVGPPALLVKLPVDNSWSWAAPPSCKPCAAGYSAQPGSASCSLCPPGTYSLAGASSCLPCPAGTYGSSAGLTSPACTGACASAAACPLGTAYPPPIAGLACASSGARSAPSTLGLLLWPAAHPANPRRLDLVIAPLSACSQLTGADCSALPAGYSIVGADGVTRYVVGTAADLHLEAAEALACSAQ
jgi:DNA-binding beta-propeller fold protein YncE